MTTISCWRAGIHRTYGYLLGFSPSVCCSLSFLRVPAIFGSSGSCTAWVTGSLMAWPRFREWRDKKTRSGSFTHRKYPCLEISPVILKKNTTPLPARATAIDRVSLADSFHDFAGRIVARRAGQAVARMRTVAAEVKPDDGSCVARPS